MKSLGLVSTAPRIRSSPFLSLSRTRFALKIPASLYLSPPKRCGVLVSMYFSNPEKRSSSSSEGLSTSQGGIMSRASISILEDQSINNFKAQVGSPVSPHSINPLAKLSLSDQAFLLLAFIACTTSVAFTSLVIAAVPTLVAMARAASSFAKLADTARQEFPSTMAAIRLSGMEISDLTLELSDLSQEITDGVNKSAKAVQAAEAGIRQIGTLAHQQTLSMIEERASLPEISLQPVVAGAAKKTSHAIGRATKTLMNIITGGDNDEDSLDM
ncbi:hypothetical protein EUTSA_v10008466mg [Eutrema salsugineum]|uniref:Uncharacterized protein n=1 Tax=Eutrema salsugineum TaxID=72664 RepID=V4MV70_EUTSA|nr:uncharacterized protein LOC18994022 [Eutrema salsugineum]ESQ36031.1 hypothetical protein EUTSA_v10008466mg [Eutrema salsugineum]